MKTLRQFWHPVLWSKEVTDKPIAVKLLDQPLVLWRANGNVSAFYDLCIHRGAALSLGWMDGGQARLSDITAGTTPRTAVALRIPSLPPDREIPAKARAKSYRVQERYGLVWVCLDEPRQDIPQFPPEFDDPAFNWAPYKSEGQWRANAARMIENLADFSHFPWVHAGILGDPDRPESPVIDLARGDGGFQYEIDTPVNRICAPGPSLSNVYTVILPFMVTIQRSQPGGDRAPYQYLSVHPGGRITKPNFIRLAGRNYRDRKPTSN